MLSKTLRLNSLSAELLSFRRRFFLNSEWIEGAWIRLMDSRFILLGLTELVYFLLLMLSEEVSSEGTTLRRSRTLLEVNIEKRLYFGSLFPKQRLPVLF